MIVLSILLTSCGFANDESVGLECQRLPADGGEVREGQDPLAPGGPLAGLPVDAMTAEEVGEQAQEAGFGVTYRYQYDLGSQSYGGGSGYSECWCVPPPPGRVFAVAYDSIGRIVVMVDSGETRDSVRPQPEMGWGCDGEPAAS